MGFSLGGLVGGAIGFAVGGPQGAAAGYSIGSGLDASNKASSAQENAANNASALQKYQFDKQVELQEPFRQAGLKGQNRLMELLGVAGDPNAQGYGSAMRDFSAQDFQTDPGYQFRQQQGQQGLERSASARGGLLSGAAMKDAMRFNQDLASGEYTNAFNRFQTNRSNKLNPLQSLSNLAQTSTNNIANAGQTYANNAGNLMMGAADARASGYLMNNRITSNGANQLGASFSRSNPGSFFNPSGSGSAVGSEVGRLGSNTWNPLSDFNTGANGWGSYGE